MTELLRIQRFLQCLPWSSDAGRHKWQSAGTSQIAKQIRSCNRCRHRTLPYTLQHQRCFPRTLARQRSRLCARLRSRSQPGAGVERNRTRCICRIHSNDSARSTALSGQRSRACMWTLSAASTAVGRMKVAPRMENCTLVYIHRTHSRHTLLASLANSCRRSSSSRPLLSRRERWEACSLESNQLGLGRGPAQYSAVAELIQTNDHRIARICFQWAPPA